MSQPTKSLLVYLQRELVILMSFLHFVYCSDVPKKTWIDFNFQKFNFFSKTRILRAKLLIGKNIYAVKQKQKNCKKYENSGAKNLGTSFPINQFKCTQNTEIGVSWKLRDHLQIAIVFDWTTKSLETVFFWNCPQNSVSRNFTTKKSQNSRQTAAWKDFLMIVFHLETAEIRTWWFPHMSLTFCPGKFLGGESKSQSIFSVSLHYFFKHWLFFCMYFPVDKENSFGDN